MRATRRRPDIETLLDTLWAGRRNTKRRPGQFWHDATADPQGTLALCGPGEGFTAAFHSMTRSARYGDYLLDFAIRRVNMSSRLPRQH